MVFGDRQIRRRRIVHGPELVVDQFGLRGLADRVGELREVLEERFGAVFLIALHSEPQIRRRAVEIGLRHLEPGGWFVLEGFATSQARRGTMGPTDPDKLYDLAETISWIEPTCRVFEALEGMVLLAEGEGHDGPADMVRILARRRKK